MKSPLAVLICCVCLQGADTRTADWQIQYFHDERDSTLSLIDLVFPSVARGIAAGVLTTRGSQKPTVLVTSNGGETWTQNPGPDTPRSLFCLDETACWLVGEKGIWFSAESGRTWKRIYRDSALNAVYFLSRDHGWAIGASKKMLETRDAGKTWTKIAALETLKTSTERTVFHAIAFINEKAGMVTGRSEPPREHKVPVWMDESPELHRERPAVSILLGTHDAGATWTTSTASMFGRMSRLGTARGVARALGLVEFERLMEYPAEVYSFDLRNGQKDRVFRRKDVAVTDVAVCPDGSGLIAGFDPPGALAHTPVPGKLRIFRSKDLTSWTEMSADYRAVAHRVSAAAIDANHMWLATDTGMILRLSGNLRGGG